MLPLVFFWHILLYRNRSRNQYITSIWDCIVASGMALVEHMWHNGLKGIEITLNDLRLTLHILKKKLHHSFILSYFSSSSSFNSLSHNKRISKNIKMTIIKWPLKIFQWLTSHGKNTESCRPLYPLTLLILYLYLYLFMKNRWKHKKLPKITLKWPSNVLEAKTSAPLCLSRKKTPKAVHLSILKLW